MSSRRQAVEHPFGKSWMGATHFPDDKRSRTSAQKWLCTLTYNMKRDNEHSWRRRLNGSAPHLKPVVRASDASAHPQTSASLHSLDPSRILVA